MLTGRDSIACAMNPLNFVNNFSGVSVELIDELQGTLKGIPFEDKARAEINELTDTLRGNLDKVVQHGKRADAIVKNMLLQGPGLASPSATTSIPCHSQRAPADQSCAHQLTAKWPQAVQVKPIVPSSRDRSRSGLPELRQE